MIEHPEQRVELPARPASVGAARSFVGRALNSIGVPPDVCDATLLLTSELVTNAVLYAGGVVTVGVGLAAGMLRVTVGDDSAEHPRPQNPTATDTSGRGLLLVDALAAAWGVDTPPDDGKVVWFEMSP